MMMVMSRLAGERVTVGTAEYPQLKWNVQTMSHCKKSKIKKREREGRSLNFNFSSCSLSDEALTLVGTVFYQ